MPETQQKEKDTQKNKASAMIHPITSAINATFTACLVLEGGMKRKQTSITTFTNNKSQKPPQYKYGNSENPCCRIFFIKKAVCM